jgi:hypothetical protein
MSWLSVFVSQSAISHPITFKTIATATTDVSEHIRTFTVEIPQTLLLTLEHCASIKSFGFDCLNSYHQRLDLTSKRTPAVGSLSSDSQEMHNQSANEGANYCAQNVSQSFPHPSWRRVVQGVIILVGILIGAYLGVLSPSGLTGYCIQPDRHNPKWKQTTNSS